jgi:hypothetical protein
MLQRSNSRDVREANAEMKLELADFPRPAWQLRMSLGKKKGPFGSRTAQV